MTLLFSVLSNGPAGAGIGLGGTVIAACADRGGLDALDFVDTRAKIQGTRLAGAIARTQGTFQSGMLALHKMRTGGQQTVRVVHQRVTVNDGAQAVVAGEMNTRQPTGGRRKRTGGGTRK